ncbi:hypothetical protein [Enterobacter hormaechei]|uniref:hypothetical protein n=1 Tax=Enterobacter hormaechei TaxID=158836 RepID=UPI000DE78A9A|nr:hypothetical protein [Enterobacter hormaechei]EBS2684418.1 hypothetical protein [Salmonella enterica subsp. enterica serovar Montevideo]HCL1979800.1 hypothetical protein [Salmonella enterica subsp. enterica serovar Infantis]HEG2123458.1 hypothetical protein [Enterobacter kobei]SSI88341.1 Uncharacterised protein [Enterobacter hormaechei]HEG2174341.1 hypothetical protein [Enterobacter kobei]
MKNATNTVKNDDLDELTAMLQSLDEPTAQAAKASGSDEIDDLLAGLNDDIGKPVEAVAEEVIQANAANDLTKVFEELEVEHKPVKVVEPEATPVSEPAATEKSTAETQPCESKGVDPAPSPTPDPEPKAEVTESKPQKAKGERAPAKPRFTLADKDEAFYAKAGLESAVFSEAFDKAPVKAKDKILNLLNWFSGGPEISIYTVIAMRHILETKTATSNSIKLALMSYPEKPYPLNTASTQAGQMMAVFPATGVATREGGCLTLNDDSPIVKKFIAEYSFG